MSTVFPLAPVVFFNASATRLFLVSLKYLDSTKNVPRVSVKNQVREPCLPGFYETY